MHDLVRCFCGTSSVLSFLWAFDFSNFLSRALFLRVSSTALMTSSSRFCLMFSFNISSSAFSLRRVSRSRSIFAVIRLYVSLGSVIAWLGVRIVCLGFIDTGTFLKLGNT